MSDSTNRFELPLWGWIVGFLGLLTLCGCLAVGVLVLASLFLGISAASTSGVSTVVFTTMGAASPRPSPTRATATPLPSPTTTVESTATSRPPASPTPIEAEEPSPTSPPVEDPHADERAEIEANVVEIRGLEPLEPVVPTLLTVAGLRQQLEADLAEDYSPEESRNDAIALSAFDFLAADFDLYTFTLDLYTEQVAGYYDPETNEFVVISDDDEFDVLEQWTHAHEYVHALQDQHFNLDLLDDEMLDSEASFALRALAEGDATLVQTLYLFGGYFSQAELGEILEAAGEVDTTVLDSGPPILARNLEFPYISGLEFVQALYEAGGFESVNEAWENPPQTTEHILHPDRYLAGDAPQVVALAPLTETLGAGWQQVDEDIFGEFFLRQYLAQQLDESAVETAATGWGGDRYAVYWNEDRQSLVMLLRLAWDTAADGDEFANAYAAYPAALFGSAAQSQPDGGQCWQGGDVICLYRLDNETLIVRVPDLATAAAVAAQQG
ncbi:MAG: hypothetical protein L0332_14435 [Chloroflexi bacterium]|nr:hypothetical protein [Chloroflexota bacterium]MCI0575543.1 hypothetical protein [Chloroflexota bacterium]MCI0644083.1 hypothetical protein [Chloroflexota bacterium]MCI0727899.1 hypothetical protein [Chloroflexota bacterium]